MNAFAKFSLLTFAAISICTCAGNHPAQGLEGAAIIPVESSAEKITQTRRHFADAFALIKKGMPAEQVQTLLGKPDDIITEADPDGVFGLAHTREIWAYGTDHHLGFGTLGTIALDTDNHVQYLHGTQGGGELVDQLGEPELRRLLRILALASETRLGGYDYNPRGTIAAVNAFFPLGRKIGIAVMREYLDVSFQVAWGDSDGLFLVMHALFEVPPLEGGAAVSRPASDPESYDVVQPGYFRSPAIALDNWCANDHTRFPLFPLVLTDDIPLAPTWAIGIGGAPGSPSRHLDDLEKGAPSWRQRPLKPTDDPMGAFETLFKKIPEDIKQNDELAPLVAWQLLHLVDTVYRDPAIEEDKEAFYPPAKAMGLFNKAVTKVRALHIHWNPQSGCYVFADGSMLPPVIKPFYRRTVFEPHFVDNSGYSLKVIVAREDAKGIHILTEFTDKTGKAPQIRLRVIRLGPTEEILRDDVVNPNGPPRPPSGSGYSSFGTLDAALPAAEEVRIEVSTSNQYFSSPDIQP